MTVPAFHVEAKLHAFRKTQDGVVVSFVVSPIDMPQALALDPLGTRYMLALAQIGDDEQPIPSAGKSTTPPQPINRKDVTAAAEPDGTRSPTAPPAEGTHKDRRAWDDLRPSQQAGILCSDIAFQQFASTHTGWNCDEEDAAAWLRDEFDINSRRELDLRADLAPKLNELRAEFLEWAGRAPVPVR